MAVYKNAVVMFAGGEMDGAVARTTDCVVAFTVEMPNWDTEFDQPGAGAGITVKAPDGYEIGLADIADDSSYVTIAFVAAGGGGGGED